MKKLENKKLLILAGAAVHSKVVDAANDMGVYTVVTDYLPDSPGKQIADEAWNLNILEVDEIVEKCRNENVDGVLSFCIDPCQRPYQQICEKLSVPCYGSKEQFFKMTDKTAFKNLCQKAGVDTIPSYTKEEVLSNPDLYPLFIKPVDSRGSRGQTKCYSSEDIIKAIEEAEQESSNGEVLIEKCMDGYQDFTISCLIKDKKPYIIRTADRFLGQKNDHLDRQSICSISPSQCDDSIIESLKSKLDNFVDELGLDNGIMFFQGFLDGDTVRFYDPGLRLPGADYEILLRDVTGVDVMKIMIQYALTGKMEIPDNLEDCYKLNGNISIQLLICAKPGTISVYEGFDELKNHPNVVSVSKRTKVGETVPASGNVQQRIAEVVVLAPDRDSIPSLVDYVYNNIKVLDENGVDMIVSKYNPYALGGNE